LAWYIVQIGVILAEEKRTIFSFPPSLLHATPYLNSLMTWILHVIYINVVCLCTPQIRLDIIFNDQKMYSMSPRSNWAHGRLLSKILASWTLPGDLATMFPISKFGPQTAWTSIEKYPFRFLKRSAFSSPGHDIFICTFIFSTYNACMDMYRFSKNLVGIVAAYELGGKQCTDSLNVQLPEI
jgi:hypothetical protein